MNALLIMGIGVPLGWLASQAPRPMRIYWRYFAAPTGFIGACAIMTHNEPLLALVVRLWVGTALGMLIGMVISGGWWRRRWEDGPEPMPGPGGDGIPEPVDVRSGDLDLWAAFDATARPTDNAWRSVGVESPKPVRMCEDEAERLFKVEDVEAIEAEAILNDVLNRIGPPPGWEPRR